MRAEIANRFRIVINRDAFHRRFVRLTFYLYFLPVRQFAINPQRRFRVFLYEHVEIASRVTPVVPRVDAKVGDISRLGPSEVGSFLASLVGMPRAMNVAMANQYIVSELIRFVVAVYLRYIRRIFTDLRTIFPRFQAVASMPCRVLLFHF